ncbi:MAG TPA: flagellar export chaperone FliS [Burkholderiaceae bacterium]
MANFGAKAYSNVAAETGVAAGDPHQLIQMMYDGAVAALNEASGHLTARRVAQKCAAIAKASRIVDQLLVSVDPQAGGEIGRNLVALYEYMSIRLLHANLRNDPKAIAEVGRLLAQLRSAWMEIRGQAAAQAGAAAAIAAASAAQPAVRAAPQVAAAMAATRG